MPTITVAAACCRLHSSFTPAGSHNDGCCCSLHSSSRRRALSYVRRRATATKWCYACGLAVEDCDKAPRVGEQASRPDEGCITLHNVGWEENERRCPWFLNEIERIDPAWKQPQDCHYSSYPQWCNERLHRCGGSGEGATDEMRVCPLKSDTLVQARESIAWQREVAGRFPRDGSEASSAPND